MKILKVDLGADSYNVFIGGDIFSAAGTLLNDVYPGARTVIISDSGVWRLYGNALLASIEKASLKTDYILIEPGEKSKSLKVYESVCSQLIKKGISRNDLLIAFGGGVCGDLSGFVAATYMRGIPYAQIPSTLLAQVDSSIGGKTALNLKEGKNLAGAFYQPKIVISDTSLQHSLNEREFACGMAEVIKYALIASPALLAKLKDWGGRKNAAKHMNEIVYQCCRIKASLVAEDALDSGARRLLNFGHTVGHAIEKLSGCNHGEAVAQGMIKALEIGEKLGFGEEGLKQTAEELLTAYGLPCCGDFKADALLPYIMADKKRAGENIRMALLKRIGAAEIKEVKADALAELLNSLTKAARAAHEK
jgi:3-dehydroquinate synthase